MGRLNANKLASNTKLRRNLEKQVPIYQKASDAPRALQGIIYFTEGELARVQTMSAPAWS